MELGDYLKSVGEPGYRAGQVFAALHNGVAVSDIPNIPKSLRERLAADFCCELPATEQVVTSKDGTKKFLLKTITGDFIECVLLTQDYGRTVCISSQVGCKMGCAFCASGRDGFVRNLSAGEMLAQVLVSARQGRISHIVVMGSGEPFDNYDEVIKFLSLVTAAGGINVGARSISVSTSGIVPKIREFADLGLGVNLCISLHAPNDEIRTGIMPVARKYPIADLLAAAKYFFEKTHRRVIFEYALIDGINTAPEHAVALAKLVKGFPSHVNLINLNATGGALKPPTRETAMKFMDTLIKAGASATMRKSRGSDIAGACGQLKTKFATKK